MGVQVYGPDGEPARVSRYGAVSMALGPKQGNQFAAAFQTGIMPAGLSADIEIFQMRWTNTDYLAAIDSISLSVANLATAFAAGGARFDLTRSTGWSSDGTGGAAATSTSPFGKLDTAQTDASRVGSMRIATTAGLGAGTKTLDSNFLKSVEVGIANTAGLKLLEEFFLWSAIQGDHPLILRASEGLSVRAEVPATGTWQVSLNIKWRELANADWIS